MAWKALEMEPTSALALASIMQGLSGAYGSYEQAKAGRRISKTNERIAAMQAQSALARGHEAEGISRQRGKKMLGSQRAALAAQGIRLDAGSAQDIQQETLDIGELDALTIKNNALREAFGYKMQGISESMQGRLTYQAGMNQATGSLLTGGIKAYDYYRQTGKL